jgi:hypothetical protein
MPPKPRSQGKRKPPPSKGDDRRNLLLLGIGGAAVLAIAAVALAFTLGGGGGGGGGDARAALEQAGCTLSATPSLRGVHSITSPSGTSPEWNTDPPTSGPHYEVPVVYGIYDEPVYQAQLVHNLEHGAVFIQYGAKVPSATVDQLMEFYADHRKGTVVAPLPALGRTIALGAWIVPSRLGGAKGDGALATCTRFDESAFAAFLSAFQFEGPERFSPDSMLPGST